MRIQSFHNPPHDARVEHTRVFPPVGSPASGKQGDAHDDLPRGNLVADLFGNLPTTTPYRKPQQTRAYQGIAKERNGMEANDGL